MHNIFNSPKIIAGSGRSGTTWILDCLAESNKLDTIFEPLHPKCVPGARKFANCYIREEDSVPELQNFIEKIFNADLKSIWTNYRIRPDRFQPWSDNPAFQHQNNGIFSKGKILLSGYKEFFFNYLRYRKKTGSIIVKFIRANLMLGWISKNFDAKIVLVVRHPCSVVTSRLKLIEKDGVIYWGVNNSLQDYWNDINLREDYLYKYEDLFKSKQSLISELTMLWCIENSLPIIKAQRNGTCIMFYEDLLMNPDKNWEIIIKTLGLKNVPNREMWRKPSHEASKEIRNNASEYHQINKWKSYLKKNQINEIDKILIKFRINIYNVHEPLPINRLLTDEHFSK